MKRAHWLFPLALVACREPAPTPKPVAPRPQMRAASPARPTAAAPKAEVDRYAPEVARLKKELPGFTVVVVEPFVVVGDGSPQAVRQRGAGIVRWAVSKLKQDHFQRDPKDVLTVYLFKDRRSYRHHTKKLWNEVPDTPYGYYSPSDRALVMNIATGGGTLVHEIVHPFMEANFPACPAWFNEGLGSLYEQSAEREGRIVGLTNWRLAGLQRTIRAGEMMPLKALLSTSSRAFYDDDSGTHYAASRYLLYYLQERKLLRQYHRDFRRDHAQDPTGLVTLKKALGLGSDAELAAFQKRWEKWVLQLRFNAAG